MNYPGYDLYLRKEDNPFNIKSGFTSYLDFDLTQEKSPYTNPTMIVKGNLEVTSGGTLTLKDASGGVIMDFAPATGAITFHEVVTFGTIIGAVSLGTPTITGGTATNLKINISTIGTPSITAGTYASGLLGSCQITGGTVNNAIVGTPAITSGTATSSVLNTNTIGTPNITGGTWTSATLGTPQITGGTINNAILGTPAITGGTTTGMTMNSANLGSPSVSNGTLTSVTINNPAIATPSLTGGTVDAALFMSDGSLGLDATIDYTTGTMIFKKGILINSIV